MKTLFLATAALVGLSTPAFAQEQNAIGGFKVGLVGGYDWVELETEDGKLKGDDFLYGVTAGYDLQSGNAIVGVEVEYSDPETDIKLGDGDSFRIRADRQIYAGLRVGGQVAPSLLLYAKGGYVNSKFSIVQDFAGSAEYAFADKMDGYRLGAGAEYQRGRTFGRVEYRYTDSGNYKISDFDTGFNVSRHQVVAAAGVRF